MAQEQTEATFTLRGWGHQAPNDEALANELERIARMVREGYTAGEAFMDEDYPGRGWWDMKQFEEAD
jgi:hypothetical protein